MTDVTQPAGAIRSVSGFYDDAVMAPDGHSILVSAHSGGVSRIDLATGSVTGHWQFGSKLGGMDVTPDGRYLLATEADIGASNSDGSTNISVYRLDLASGQVDTFTTSTGSGYRGFYDVATTSDGKAILTQDYAGSGWVPLTTLDVATGAFTTPQTSYAQDGVLVSAGGHQSILFGPQNISDAPLFVYTSGTGVTAAHQLYADNVSGFNRGVEAISASGRYVAQFIGPLHIYDGSLHYITNLGDLHPELGGDDAIVGMAFSSDEKSLYLLDTSADLVYQVSTSDWSVQAAIPIGVQTDSIASDYGDRLTISPDGRYLTAIANASVQIIDLHAVVAQTNLDGDNVLTGGAGADTLNGFGGNDVLDGGLGRDTMRGGSGDDSYYVDNPSDIVAERPDQGFDTVYTSVSLALPYSTEKLVAIGHGAIALTGGSGNDILVGNDADNALSGGAGIDTLTGGGGHDVFSGTPDDLAFDTITDLSIGDSIDIEQNPATFTRVDDRLDYGNARYITLAGDVAGRIVFQKDAGSMDLTVVNHDAKITDLDGNGHSDLLWRNSDGGLSVWSIGGDGISTDAHQNSFYASVGTDWHVVETFDFNGDGRSDVLWRNDNGTFSVWDAVDGGLQPGSYTDGSVGTDWRIAGVGDLNGDGKDDLVWQRSDGAVSAWQSTGTGFVANTYFHESPGATWHVAGLADFNGDGRADILWRNVDGSVSTWLGTTGGFAENAFFASVDKSWHVAGLGDIDGDGREDLVWQNDNGAISTWFSNGQGFAQNTFYAPASPAGSIADTGDFDADGKTDLLLRDGHGTLTVMTWNGTGFDPQVIGTVSDQQWSITHHDYLFG